jgi:protein SCO1/2
VPRFEKQSITARLAGADGSRRRSRVVLLIIFAFFCAAAVVVFWSWRNPAPHGKTELPVLGTVGEFQLTAEDGRNIARAFLQGRITVCQLVCSRCGSPCPLLLSRFAELDQNFHGSSRLQLLSVTTDPLIDQPPVLARLRQRYEGSSHWVFVTGQPGEIARFAAGVFGTAPDLRGDQLRQTATDVPLLVLVDQEAQIRQRYQGTDQEVVAAILDDVGTLLRNRQTSAK